MSLAAFSANNFVSSANLQAAKKSCEFWLTSEKMDGKEGKVFGSAEILCLNE